MSIYWTLPAIKGHFALKILCRKHFEYFLIIAKTLIQKGFPLFPIRSIVCFSFERENFLLNQLIEVFCDLGGQSLAMHQKPHFHIER